MTFSYTFFLFHYLGESGLGKSTLVNTLFKAKISRTSCTPPPHPIPQTVEVSSVSHGELTLLSYHQKTFCFFFGINCPYKYNFLKHV